ncbi:thioredoxin domain-containing protein [Cardiosporidium cionae]|uniref:Thioredoxin domain-containing protein n=1 Tax=Cardiosporidium cionae TaxID=476202 RepID=A0ABQ7J8C8_9APIC|nr:thioredoxin domain-containing protein [Cardiosporidium cionae]|eukprot:KAF8819910.1 thioredoxin domain-containing protein [Cardiosporidium cionae]
MNPVESGSAALTATVEEQVLKVLEKEEEKLDRRIEKLNSLNDNDLEDLREKRLRQLKASQSKRKLLENQGHLTYTELVDQKEFFSVAKQSSLLVVHFYRPTTWRCSIVDRRLQVLASRYIATRFVKINAEKAHFLCDYFKIWCIPTLMLIKDGKTSHSIVGLDELGGDNFTAEDLERVLAKHHLLEGYD